MFERLLGKAPALSEEAAPRVEPELSAPAINNAADSTGISITDIEALSDVLGLGSSLAGPAVTPKTSMKVAVVFACVRLIAGAIAQLSLPAYQTTEKGRERVNIPESALLNLQPTPAFSAAAFWEYIVTCMLLHGDGFAVIYRNRNGEALELLPVSPLDVNVVPADGRLAYSVKISNKAYAFDQDDVLHFPGFGFNGVRSMSVIKWGAYNSIGLELAMEQYSGEFFQNGATQSIAVVKSADWNADAQQSFREAWTRVYGGQGNRKYPLTIGNGMDIKELSVNAKDSQLLESREFQITDIARAFGLPSFMVNQEQKSTSWGTGVAEIGLSFLRFTLMPHLNRFEQELNRKLFLYKPYMVEWLTDALLRSTTEKRYDAYRTALGGPGTGPGWLAVNEVRRLDNLPRIDNPIFDMPYDERLLAGESNDTQS